MENLWAPWRMKYIKDENESDSGCVFCDKLASDKDKENLVLHRAKSSFIIMNLYPYTNGHLMVVPNRHTADFIGLSDEESNEINSLLKKCAKSLSETMKAQGFNVGVNIGRIAGAGIADHIHWHIVPRWEADTNFMPIINDVRVIPQALDEAYDLIKGALDE